MAEVINDRKLERKYAVGNGPGPVLLTVIIGDAQIGGSAVFIDNKLIAKGQILHVPVGAPADLVGHLLGINTVVADVNEQTNKSSVTYILTGGGGEAEYTLQFEAQKDKQQVLYSAIFAMV